MGMMSNIRRSQKKWKEKAIARGDVIRDQNRKIKKLEEEKKDLKEELKQKENSGTVPVNPTPLEMLGNEKFQIFYLMLLFFIYGNISFRAVSRILKIMVTLLNLGTAPCIQTCINAVLKLSIAKMLHVKNIVTAKNPSDLFSNGWIWLLDTSIAMASGKILTVLALPANFYRTHNRAPTLEDLYTVGVAVANSWTGIAIANFLKEIISVIGRPLAFLKDGGTDLSKASNILGLDGFPVLNIADISHVIANILKQHYKNHSLINIFLSACGKASSKFKQSILACLYPPALRTKARFMNIILLVRWAKKILDLSPAERGPEGSLIEKLRLFVGELADCRAFIHSFLADATPLINCQEILKNHGLNEETYQQCIKIVSGIPSEQIRLKFTNWLDQQLSLAAILQLKTIGLPISSDPIESLFGRVKFNGTGPIKDPNRIAMRIPALCGELTVEDAQRAMKVTTAELNNITMPLETLIKQRRKHMISPDNIEQLTEVNLKQYIRFIPGSNPGFKTANQVDISTKIENYNDPGITLVNAVEKSA